LAPEGKATRCFSRKGKGAVVPSGRDRTVLIPMAIRLNMREKTEDRKKHEGTLEAKGYGKKKVAL